MNLNGILVITLGILALMTTFFLYYMSLIRQRGKQIQVMRLVINAANSAVLGIGEPPEKIFEKIYFSWGTWPSSLTGISNPEIYLNRLKLIRALTWANIRLNHARGLAKQGAPMDDMVRLFKDCLKEAAELSKHQPLLGTNPADYLDELDQLIVASCMYQHSNSTIHLASQGLELTRPIAEVLASMKQGPNPPVIDPSTEAFLLTALARLADPRTAETSASAANKTA